MKKSFFAIRDGSRRKSKPCAFMKWSAEKGFQIDIQKDASVETVPAFFIPFVERGELGLSSEEAAEWVRERIPPSGRQNLGEILDAHSLSEYNEIELLRSSRGESSQDSFIVQEIDAESYERREVDQASVQRKALGKAIKERRLNLGLSQRELADEIGISQPALSKIETGMANITFDMLVDIDTCLSTDEPSFLRIPETSLWTRMRNEMKRDLSVVNPDHAIAYESLVNLLEALADEDKPSTPLKYEFSLVYEHYFRSLRQIAERFECAEENHSEVKELCSDVFSKDITALSLRNQLVHQWDSGFWNEFLEAFFQSERLQEELLKVFKDENKELLAFLAMANRVNASGEYEKPQQDQLPLLAGLLDSQESALLALRELKNPYWREEIEHFEDIERKEEGRKKNSVDIRAAVEKIPSVKKLRETLDGYKKLARFFYHSKANEELNEIRIQIDNLVNLIVGFYELLGDRHWVFSDYISTKKVEEMVATNSADEAEQIIISWLQEDHILNSLIMRLNRFQDMRPRIHQLEKAARDYLEGRYYSVVLVLVSVMDGFVSDVDKQHRKGLHARTPDELDTEDTIATISVGLPSAQVVFREPVKRRHDEKLFDIKRHGIMHGMETNYNNIVIASKAWCMLFGVCDWANNLLDTGKESQECEQKIAFSELLDHVRQHEKEKAEFESNFANWQSYEVDFEQMSDADREIIDSVNKYFEAWKVKNYGHLGQFFPNFTDSSFNKLAAEARSLYEEHPIQSYEIISVNRPAPAIADVEVRLASAERIWQAQIRFVKYDGTTPAAEWERGMWKAIRYGTDPFAGASG